MNKTSIPWTEFSSNPLIAINRENGKRGWWCSKVSPGCAHCYSERINCGRLGNCLTYVPQNAEKVRWVVNADEFEKWKRRKKPTKIFVCDMIDLFHDSISYELIRRVFEAMLDAPQHTFQVLTKRPQRMLSVLQYASFWGGLSTKDIQHIWLGVSVENQRFADERIPVLLQIPASVHFLSCEPLLGHVQLEVANEKLYFRRSYLEFNQRGKDGTEGTYTRVEQVIAGGESGTDFRNPPGWFDMARSLRSQCKAADVAFFYKQAPGRYPGLDPLLDGIEYHEFPHGD